VAAGELGLGYAGIVGQLGLQGMHLAAGELGLAAVSFERSGELGLAGGYFIAVGSVGLMEGVNPITDYWLDTFTDTNGTSIGSHTGEITPGGYALQFSSTAYIQGNQLTNNSNNYTVQFDPAVDTYTGEYRFSWDTNSQGVFVFFRFSDDFNRWEFRIFPGALGVATQFEIICAAASVFLNASLTMNAFTEYLLTLVVTPTSISATINGVNISTTNSTLGTQTKQQLQAWSSSNQSNFFNKVHVHS